MGKEGSRMEAEQVMRAVRRRIMKRIPFLSPVLDAIEWRAWDSVEGLGTDGRTLFYCPKYVREAANDGRYGPLELEYLHAVCHIICGHPSQCPSDERDRLLFGICADLKAGWLHMRLLEHTAGKRRENDAPELSWRYCNVIERAGVEGVFLRELYWKVKGSEGRRTEMENLGQMIRMDDHCLWGRIAAMPVSGTGAASHSGRPGSGTGAGRSADAKPENRPAAGGKGRGEEAAEGSGQPFPAPPDEQWFERLKRVIEAMQIMAGPEASRRLLGSSGGSLGFNCYYEAAEENHRSYREFLEQYLVREETCREDDGEIDYIWYTYGMDCWGNIPIIESPEVTEQPALKQIAIAIDTSGSCQGEPVRRFLRETSNILRTYENMEPDILVFQADSRICREDRITSLNQLERYLAEGRISGGGGTDFIPVIRRMEELNRSGREQPFKLLIYLSDGMGSFPERKPAFDVAFALAGDWGAGEMQLPEWVIPLRLNRDESQGEPPEGGAPGREPSTPKRGLNLDGTEGGFCGGICSFG